LDAEVIQRHCFRDLTHCQRDFDRWRDIYNLERPHESLQMEVPAQRYRPSTRAFPEHLPAIEYGPGDQVRKVQDHGQLFFKGREFRICKALHGGGRAGTRDRPLHVGIAGMASLRSGRIVNCGGGVRANADRALWHAGTSTDANLLLRTTTWSLPPQ
jgi:hypothetical protein